MTSGAVPLAGGQNIVQFCYGKVVYTDAEPVEAGTLPPGAYLTNIYVDITDPFTSDDQNVLTISYAPNVVEGLSASIAVCPDVSIRIGDANVGEVHGISSGVAFGTVDHRLFPYGATLFAEYDPGSPGGGLPSAGEAFVIFEYVPTLEAVEA